MVRVKVSGATLEKRYKAPRMPQGPIQDGGRLDASDLSGRWVVLYFYPKDLTPGCTTESQDFQSALAQIERLGARVVGCSRDSAERHTRFAEKLSLTFPLVADDDGSLCQAWEVWKEKKLYGKTFMGIERSTFLVDPSGQVAAEWRKVKVTGHVQEVMSVLNELVNK
jgi:peroxiredoxin Q/BCP